MKRGISLIAVLMFMLAATTASVVIFRIISSENFSSGARLKASEAYQASESGLDAVQSWLTNRAPDAGALIGEYVYSGRKPIHMTGAVNVLGNVGNSSNKNFDVYLMGVDENINPRKLKFMSIGRGRDNSQVIQTAFFTVDGLYTMSMNVEGNKCLAETDFSDAVFGIVGANTQSNWSSGTVKSDNYIGSQIRTVDDFLASGNVTLVSGTWIGVDSSAFANNQNRCPTDISKAGDSYIVGDLMGDQLTFCGNVYVGGKVRVNGTMTVHGDLYVAGDLELNQNLVVNGNLTIGGNLSLVQNASYTLTIGKDLLMLPRTNGTPSFASGNASVDVKGRVWLPENTSLTGSNLRFATSTTAVSPNHIFLAGVSPADTRCWYANAAYFTSPKGCVASAPGTSYTGKVTEAKKLEELKARMDENNKVVEPLMLPPATKEEWHAKAKTLLDAANNTTVNSSGVPQGNTLPADCVRLLKTKEGAAGADISDNKYLNAYCKSTNLGSCSAAQFVSYLGACYSQLAAQECVNASPLYLYKGADGQCYLPVKLALNQSAVDGSRRIDGNFIFIFDPKPSVLRLPSTTDASKVFVFLPHGATKLEANGVEGNYFIFSEGDIDESAGNGRIKGTIYMAKDTKIGNIKDTRVSFNAELFNALLNAGILSGTNPNANPNDPSCQPTFVNDPYYIPVSSRLAVKLESKEISKEKEPAGEGNFSSLSKRVLVMPRVVRLAKDDIKAQGDFRKFYTYMYLNGATDRDGSASEPNCTFIGSVLQELHRSGNINMDGFYRCEFDNPAVPHSNFYVNVGGLSGTEIQINPPTGDIQKGKIGSADGSGCVNISLTADDANATESWRVNVSVKSGGNLWDVTRLTTSSCDNGNKTSGWTCYIPQGQKTANVLKVCPNTTNDASRSAQIVLQIGHSGQAGYKIDDSRNMSVINIHTEEALVVRDYPSDSYVDCPFKPAVWANVSCMNYKLNFDNMRWSCEVSSTATLNITPGDACTEKIESGNSLTVSSNESMNRFIAGLEWKSYSVNVVGGSLSFSAQNVNIPENSRSSNGHVTTFRVYHGANYTVTSATPTAFTCSPNVCTVIDENTISLLPTASINGVITITLGGHMENCEYQPSWCNDKQLSEVITNRNYNTTWSRIKVPDIQAERDPAGTRYCIFAVSIENMGNSSDGVDATLNDDDDIKVNGRRLPRKGSSTTSYHGRCGGDPTHSDWSWQQNNLRPCAEAIEVEGIERADGGYYISAPLAIGNRFDIIGGTPDCSNIKLICSGMPSSATSGANISRPTVTCGGTTLSTNLSWTNAPTWSNLATGTYNVSVSATCDNEEKTANCGTLTVSPPPVLTCTDGFVATGTAGVSITQPTVKCGPTTLSSGVTWVSTTPTISWSNPTANTYTVKATADCGGSSQTANCGTLTVSTAPELTCGDVSQTVTLPTNLSTPSADKVKCGANNATSVTWKYNNGATTISSWSSLGQGTYSNITATASCGGSTKTASCTGSATVNATPVLTCGNVPSTGTVGTAITPPIVQCNGSTITTGFSWTNAPTWANPSTAATYSSVGVSVSSGTCSGRTATCSGTLVVSAASNNNCNPPTGCSNAITNTTTFPIKDQCVFYSNISQFNNSFGINPREGNVCINAICPSSNWNSISDLPAKIDGGYYIYRTATYIDDQRLTLSAGTPNCSGSTPSAPTITCAVAKTNVTQGENIGPPTINCSDGTANKSSATFAVTSGSLPTDFNNWRNTTGNAYYGTTVTGANAITVSNVTCTGAAGGSTPSGLPKTCGTITVSKPTCSGVSGTVNVGQKITPTVSCGIATKSGNPTFSVSSGTWQADGDGGSFSNAGTNRTVSLASVTCDGHSITGISGVSCGTVTVNAANAPLVITGETIIPVGTNTLSCSGGHNLTCWTTDNTEHTVKLDNADFVVKQQKGWSQIEKCVQSGTPTQSTIVTTKAIMCSPI